MHRKQRPQVHLKSTKWEFKTHTCYYTPVRVCPLEDFKKNPFEYSLKFIKP